MQPVEIILQSIKNNVRQVDVLSQNIVNANTPGYQAQQVFSLNVGDNQTTLVETAINSTKGGIISTGRDLDVAILSEGFLLVEHQSQQAITRSGHLFLSASGQLKHESGALVIGESGYINLPQGNVRIDQTGEIFVNGEFVDRLVIMSLPEKSKLESMGSGLYKSDVGMTLGQGSFKQHALNGASVVTSYDMVRLIEVSRHTQSLQKAVHALDQIANAGINELGKR
jgi:flagellar basal-body rod protein FlgF